MDKKKVVAFDFDGTLTKKDSFVEFIKFSKGPIYFYSRLPIILYYWILFKLGFLSIDIAKEKIFGFFFRGMSITEFDDYCQKFQYVINDFLKQNAITSINSYLENNYETVIISASVENWIIPWATKNNINIIIATQIATDIHGKITGKFSSKNCVGQEKVNRLLEVFPSRTSYVLEAYGDSDGDRELINFADHGFWNKIT